MTKPTPEWVAHFEAALAEHYNEPVLPVSRYCQAFRDWANAVAEKVAREVDEGIPDNQRDHGLAIVAESRPHVELAIVKSALLGRLIYGGEDIRTRMCPVHKGRWVGLPYGDNDCECQLTGWLPNEEAPA